MEEVPVQGEGRFFFVVGPEETRHPLHTHSGAGSDERHLQSKLVGHCEVESLVGHLQGRPRLLELHGHHREVVPHHLQLRDDLLQ